MGGSARGSASILVETEHRDHGLLDRGKAERNNPVPNRSSSWDKNWTENYGGYDDPNPARRRDIIPVNFTPRQNPFYCALPYNDKAREGHRPEAPNVVPWFQEAYQGPGSFNLQRPLDRDSKGNKNRLRPVGGRGPFSHRSLAICVW